MANMSVLLMRNRGTMIARPDPHPAHLYIHCPFCEGGRCHYCAFHSSVYSPAVAERWFDTLLPPELPETAPLETIYCGGGTPTALGLEGWKRLAPLIQQRFTLADHYEWTVETHPNTTSAELLRYLKAIGVNRISLGVQTLEDHVLKRINRRHTALEALRTFEQISLLGFENRGIDLIAGLVGSSMTGWYQTLEQVVALRPTHISVYALSIEEGSHFAAEGVVADEALAVEQLELAYEMLSGYTRYEVSNFALEGFECRHNLSCWHGDDYLGIGEGASSRLGLLRRTIGCDGAQDEWLSPGEDSQERALFRLRLAEGVDLATCEALRPAQSVLEAAVQRGWLQRQNERFSPTAQGFRYLDNLLREVLISLPSV